jgi:hypothetical protein
VTDEELRQTFGYRPRIVTDDTDYDDNTDDLEV